MAAKPTPHTPPNRSSSAPETVRLYEGEAERVLSSEMFADRVTLLPGAGGKLHTDTRMRILWGQDLLRDLLDGRYRTVICGVNDEDNSRGIIAQLCELVHASQWSAASVTSYAKIFHESVSVHAAHDREPYVLKFDLDSLLILAILRPHGRNHLTLDDLSRGFVTCAKMLRGRRERLPVATVSFLNARVNMLKDDKGKEPSFEAVLQSMYHAGYRGDVYASPAMWKFGHVGVFPSYPFPEGVDRMRAGSS